MENTRRDTGYQIHDTGRWIHCFKNFGIFQERVTKIFGETMPYYEVEEYPNSEN
jgi:hypothetical protein